MFEFSYGELDLAHRYEEAPETKPDFAKHYHDFYELLYFAAGEREFDAICVYADRTVTPCGICRQALSEFGDMAVICAGDDGRRREYMLSELLPAAFSGEALH